MQEQMFTSCIDFHNKVQFHPREHFVIFGSRGAFALPRRMPYFCVYISDTAGYSAQLTVRTHNLNVFAFESYTDLFRWLLEACKYSQTKNFFSIRGQFAEFFHGHHSESFFLSKIKKCKKVLLYHFSELRIYDGRKLGNSKWQILARFSLQTELIQLQINFANFVYTFVRNNAPESQKKMLSRSACQSKMVKSEETFIERTLQNAISISRQKKKTH